MRTHLRNASRRALAGTTLLVVFVVTTGLAFVQEDENGLSIPKAPDETEEQGLLLGDVLPEEVPDALDADFFDELGENWEDWSEDATELIGELYENKELSDEDRRVLVARLRAKLRTVDTCLADPSYASIHAPLRYLRSALTPRLELIDGLDGIVTNRVSTLSGDLETVLEDEILDAIDGLHSYLKPIQNGDRWASFAQLDEVQSVVEKGKGSEESLEFLGKIRDRVEELGDAEEIQSQFGSRFAFRRFVDTLNNYLLFHEAESADEFILEQILTLTNSLEEYEKTRGRLLAYRIRSRLELLEEFSPGSASVVENLLANRLLRTNLKLAVAENLVTIAINQNQNESGSVVDCILGAFVTGCQVTNADVTADVVPNPDKAEFRIGLSGVVRSNTQGRKKPATVFTQGMHYFWGSKNVTFNGTRFRTTETRLMVDPNNTTVGVSTDFDSIPLLNGIARRCASKQVAKTASEAERIAARKLAEKVVPKFDDQVDRRFRKANAQSDRRLWSRLKGAGLFPEQSRTYSTDMHILTTSRTMNILELAGGAVPPDALPGTGFSIQLHESLINNALDRINVAGRTLSEEELIGAVEKLISRAIERPFEFKEAAEQPESETEETDEDDTDELDDDEEELKLPAPTDEDGPELQQPSLPSPKTAGMDGWKAMQARHVSFNVAQDEEDDEDEDEDEDEDDAKEDEKLPATFVFDPVDPVRLKIVDNGLVLLLRSGLIQEGRREIPLHEITIPINFELVGSKLFLTPDGAKISIRPIKRRRGFGGFAIAQIRRVLQAKLPRREVDLSFELPLEGKSPIMMAVTRFESSNGWLTVVAEQMPSMPSMGMPYQGTLPPEMSSPEYGAAYPQPISPDPASIIVPESGVTYPVVQ